MGNTIDKLEKLGEQIVNDRNVQNSVSNFGKVTLQSAGTVLSAAGAALIGSGSTAAIGTAVTTAGSAIATGASAVGVAVGAVVSSPIFLIIGGVLLISALAELAD